MNWYRFVGLVITVLSLTSCIQVQLPMPSPAPTSAPPKMVPTTTPFVLVVTATPFPTTTPTITPLPTIAPSPTPRCGGRYINTGSISNSYASERSGEKMR